MTHTRSREAKKRRRKAWEKRKRQYLFKKSIYDQKTGEVVNLQEHYVQFEIVPKNLGFLNVDTFQFDVVGSMRLHEGEVLIDKQGGGTIQTRPEVFI